MFAELQKRISDATIQISQMHLLRELRATQHSHDDLIPQGWGDQLGGRPAHQMAVPFQCPGKTVTEIPIYFRLQQQSSRILSLITKNCGKMEMFQIVNRPQCFVVGDDAATGTSHYLRILLWQKSLYDSIGPNDFPPQIVDKERSHAILVQLYSASPNPLVGRALGKLQDFCYLLAIQELQKHMNYVQNKELSADDWLFLRAEKYCTKTFPMAHNGVDWSSAFTEWSKLLLVRNMTENNFKLFTEKERLLANMPSTFVSYYQIRRDAQRLCPQDDDADDNGCQELKFIKISESPVDAMVSCAVSFSMETRKIVADLYHTKLSSERRAGDVVSAIQQAEQCLEGTLLQMQVLYVCNPSGAVGPQMCVPLGKVLDLAHTILNMAQSIPNDRMSALRHRSFPTQNISTVKFPQVIERIAALVQPFRPVVLQTRDGVNQKPVVLRGFPYRWAEELQYSSAAQRHHYFIFCGFDIAEGNVLLSPTRVHIASTPSVYYSAMTCLESQCALMAEQNVLSEQQFEHGGQPRIVVRCSLLEGIEATIFNLRDSEQLMELIAKAVAENEKKSVLQLNVLLQGMGFIVPSRSPRMNWPGCVAAISEMSEERSRCGLSERWCTGK
jgi:hypothetical protein